MSVPRYEHYKQSGVEWLGEVPKHWNILPLLAVGRERDEKNIGMVESNLLSLSYGRIIRKDIDTNEGLLPESFETYQIVFPGDIIFRLTDLQNDKRSLRTAIVEERGIITSAYLALEPLNAIPQFLNYLFRAYDLRKVFYAMGSGVRQSMNYEDVKRMDILLPPLKEQTAIATFLDRETAKTDALIEEQQRLVVLLKEKRQTVISWAATKGLNPNCHMKSAGVPWLDDVPSHWDCGRKLNDLAAPERNSFVNGPFGSDLLTSELTESGIPVIYIRDIKANGYCRVSESCVTKEKGMQLQFCNVLPGDILVAKVGDPPGLAAVYPREEPEGIVTQDVIRIRADTTKVQPEFLRWLLNSKYGRTLIDSISVESTRTRIGLGEFKQLRFVLPPLAEQERIARFLAGVTERIDSLAAEANRAIDLLRERRSALISAAVTGKINVTAQVAKPVRSTWSADFARQVLAAETLSRCNGPRMGRIKLQKLIHLCEYHAQLDEVRGTYSRQAAGPFAPQVMEDVRQGLLQQRWFEEYKDESRYAYRALEKTGGHKQYLPYWKDKQAKIDLVLNLLGGELTKECEIVSTLYAAWNDLLLEGKKPTDAEIIHEASSAERWHESKEKIAAEKWPETLKWMRTNGLVPVGYGTHTMHQPDLFKQERG